MLKIFGGSARDCDGVTRRSFLQAGVLGLGGLTLPGLQRLRAEGAADAAGRSVILFWLSGGPGHMETWDPKPDAPGGFRGPFGAIPTSVPGVHFGELLPEQARRMDKLAILRSVNHGTGDHTKGNHWMLTGYEGPAFNAPDNTVQRRPSIGSAVARLGGARRPGPARVRRRAEPAGRDGQPLPLRGLPRRLGQPVRRRVRPERPQVPGQEPHAARRRHARPPGRPPPRCARRWRACAATQDPKLGDLDAYYGRAFDMLTGKAATAAFDIAAEPPALRDRYGRHTFGQSALLARRLVEAGVPFVTVNCVPWDHHGTRPQLKTEEGAKKLIPPLDRAIGALIDDLIDRGLYDSTLVVAMGEFGRTPRMNKDAGRDHWGKTFSVLMGCGSMRMGQVIGRSNERGEHVVDRPINPQDVAATVYHHLGIDARRVTFDDRAGRPTYLIDGGDPIRELVG